MLNHNLRFQERDKGITESGAPKQIHVLSRLVLTLDLALLNQSVRQAEGRVDGMSRLEPSPQNGLGAIEVAVARFHSSQSQSKVGALGIELGALVEIDSSGSHVLFLLADDSRGEQHFGIIGGQRQGFLEVVGVRPFQELL